jgi:hypothetical protein
MLNISDVSSGQIASSSQTFGNKIPTVGLKTLLQNSDLLDLLLKPMSAETSITGNSTATPGEGIDSSLSLPELDSIIDSKTKSLFDFDVTDEDFLESKQNTFSSIPSQII